MPSVDEQVPNTPEGLRRAYDASKTRGDEAETRATALAKENLFLRAGINLESTAGKLLFNGYHGDDLDELKTMATEIGALAPPPAPSQEQTAPAPGSQMPSASQTFTQQAGLPPDWEQQAADQASARSGQSHGGQDAASPHPADVAMTGYFQDLKDGMEPDEAQVKALSGYLTAAVKGDPRTRFDANAYRQQALEAER